MSEATVTAPADQFKSLVGIASTSLASASGAVGASARAKLAAFCAVLEWRRYPSGCPSEEGSDYGGHSISQGPLQLVKIWGLLSKLPLLAAIRVIRAAAGM